MTLTYQIETRTLTRRYTAVVRGEMDRDELPAWMAAALTVVRDYLHDEHIARTGPPFARYTFLGDTVAVEAGFPVAEEVFGDGLVEPSTLPAGPAAVAMHVGDYADLPHCYLAIRAWLRDHGYAMASPHWEIYHTNPAADPDPTHWRTEMVLAYRPAAATAALN
jgi:effector-binding domain-containing protein